MEIICVVSMNFVFFIISFFVVEFNFFIFLFLNRIVMMLIIIIFELLAINIFWERGNSVFSCIFIVEVIRFL